MKNKTEHFPGGLLFTPGEGAFPLSTDTVLLGNTVRLKHGSRICDLCSGSGALGLLLCGKSEDCSVTGVELHSPSHEAALLNIRQNNLDDRMTSLLGDIRKIRSLFTAGSFDCVVSNPPYFAAGARSRINSGARQEISCSLEDVFSAAAWLLQTGGSFYLVHKPERLTDIICLGRKSGLEVKEIQTVAARPGSAPSLVLAVCRRGGKPGLRIRPEMILMNPDSSPTDTFRQIYHMD